MGNRAVLVWKDKDGHYDDNTMGVYLHWNGGRDSIEAFLAYCMMKNLKSPTEDLHVGLENFVDVVSHFFGDGHSIDVDQIRNLDQNNYDNGVYICDKWSIVGRKYMEGAEQRHHKFREMLHSINDGQVQPFNPNELDKLIDKLSASRS